MFCPSCGKEIASQSKFCIACGNAIHIPDIQQNSTTDLGDSIQVDFDLPDSEIGITQEQIEPTLDEMGDSKKITIGSFEVDKRLVGGFVALLVIFSVVLLSSGEEKLDLYIEYGVLCPSCEGPIEADIETISGSTDSVLGFPDEDGKVSWSSQYEISESESDTLLWVSIIASHSDDSERVFSTYIIVDNEPIDSQSCVMDSDVQIGYAEGSGGWFTYDSTATNEC